MSLACYAPPAVAQFVLAQGSLSLDCMMALSDPQTMPAVDLRAWIGAFAATCALETPFYLLALRGRARARGQAVAILVANLATHPLVCFGIPWAVARAQGRVGTMLAIGEVFAPLTEAALLRWAWKVRLFPALALMIAGNLFSWWIGLAIFS